MRHLIDKLYSEGVLSKSEFISLLDNFDKDDMDYLFSISRKVADNVYGKRIYVRGLIEISNYCKNDCLYCGIRKSNRKADRYRLNKEDILSSCEIGYSLGFRTFVLQGGEDSYFTEERLVDIISSIKKLYSDCAITLSLGEKTYQEYLNYYNAGADRFLLRHETINSEHFERLHPRSLSLDKRKSCLHDMKRIGYQIGTGFMVGSPYQTSKHLAEDLLFIKELDPQMIGIGPFIHHQDTPFANFPDGKRDLTLLLIGILRIMIPSALIPSTTALATIDFYGRELGILAGANVVMPNLSPAKVRDKYSLYHNKLSSGPEASENYYALQDRMRKIGYELVVDRGDYKLM